MLICMLSDLLGVRSAKILLRTSVPILDGFAYLGVLGPFPNILNFHEISLTALVGTVSGRISADACHACHLKTSSHKSIQSITGLHHTPISSGQNIGQLKTHIHKHHRTRKNCGCRYFCFRIVHWQKYQPGQLYV